MDAPPPAPPLSVEHPSAPVPPLPPPANSISSVLPAVTGVFATTDAPEPPAADPGVLHRPPATPSPPTASTSTLLTPAGTLNSCLAPAPGVKCALVEALALEATPSSPSDASSTSAAARRQPARAGSGEYGRRPCGLPISVLPFRLQSRASGPRIPLDGWGRRSRAGEPARVADVAEEQPSHGMSAVGCPSTTLLPFGGRSDLHDRLLRDEIERDLWRLQSVGLPRRSTKRRRGMGSSCGGSRTSPGPAGRSGVLTRS